MVFTILLLIFAILAWAKNENAYRNRMKILDAVHDYGSECIWMHKPILADFDDMEPFERTLLRFWDWGYTRILPTEKFEIIKPYIKKGR